MIDLSDVIDALLKVFAEDLLLFTQEHYWKQSPEQLLINYFSGLIFSVIKSAVPYSCLWKKKWLEIRNCILFMNNFVQRGQNETSKKD